MPEIVVQQSLLDALDGNVAILDASGRILATNANWNQFAQENGGQRGEAYIGSNYFAALAPAVSRGDTFATEVKLGLSEAINSGAPLVAEYPCDAPEEERWFEISARRFTQGNARFLIVTHRNVTAVKAALDSQRASTLLANLASVERWAEADSVVLANAEGQILYCSNGAGQMLGVEPSAMAGMSLERLYSNAFAGGWLAARAGLSAPNQLRWRAEIESENGSNIIEAEAFDLPVPGQNTPLVMIKNRNVSDQAQEAARHTIIAREMAHRVRNVLAVVQSIARQTSKGVSSIDEFLEKLLRRIAGLAHSNELLLKPSTEQITLKALAELHLKDFVDWPDSRLAVSGSATVIARDHVQLLGMALHELATNSVKYGALSEPDGQISLRAEDQASGVTISWKETSGAIKGSRKQSGLGASILTSVMERSMPATVHYHIQPGLLEWRCTIETTRIDAEEPAISELD